MNLKLDLNSLFKRKAKNPEQEDFQANPSEQSQKAKKVLIFVKSNLLVFVLSASSITAFVAAVIFSSDLYSTNEEKAKEIDAGKPDHKEQTKELKVDEVVVKTTSITKHIKGAQAALVDEKTESEEDKLM